jgi:hypothetical protein
MAQGSLVNGAVSKDAVPTGDRWFESAFLQGRVRCEPDTMAPNGPDPITKSGPRLNRNYSAGATAPSLYSFQSLAGRSSRQNVARTGPGRLLAAAAGAGTLNQALDGRFGQILTASKESGSARSRVFPQSARQTYWNVWGNAHGRQLCRRPLPSEVRPC